MSEDEIVMKLEIRRVHLLKLWRFFFQAEDGIRDLYVTGVQTCALPISVRTSVAPSAALPQRRTPNERICGISCPSGVVQRWSGPMIACGGVDGSSANR